MPGGIYASLRYRDAQAAIEWLEHAFGMSRHVVYVGPDGAITHAELRLGDGLVMVGSTHGPLDEHAGKGWAYAVVEDLDAHFEAAKAAGAEIVREPMREEYGSFYGARDLEGNEWSFGTYQPSL